MSRLAAVAVVGRVVHERRAALETNVRLLAGVRHQVAQQVRLLLVELLTDRTLVSAASLVHLADVVRQLLGGGAAVPALLVELFVERAAIDAFGRVVLAVLLERRRRVRLVRARRALQLLVVDARDVLPQVDRHLADVLTLRAAVAYEVLDVEPLDVLADGVRGQELLPAELAHDLGADGGVRPSVHLVPLARRVDRETHAAREAVTRVHL